MMTSRLPSGWCNVTLADIAAKTPNAIVDGPFGSNLKLSDYVDQGVPVLQGKNITNDKFQWFDVRYISNSKAIELKRSSVRVGDILVVKIGSIGYSAIVDELGQHDFAIIPANLVKITANPDIITTKYLHHWLTSPEAKKYLVSNASKTAQPALSLGKIKELPLPLPSLPEQRRIVAILDQANALRGKRREALAQLDSLTQSIFIEMFGDPVNNPKRWDKKPLTEVCYCYSGGTPSKSNPDYWQGDVPWFSAKDLKQDDLFDSQDHIHESVIRTTSLKLLPADTVAIVVRGMILAHTFPVCVLRVPSTINQDLKALLPNVPLEPQFLASCLRAQSAFILQQVSEAGHGTKRLDAEAMKKILVPLPPIDIQRVFADRVRKIEELRNMQHGALSEANALFASLQHRAFRGEL